MKNKKLILKTLDDSTKKLNKRKKEMKKHKRHIDTIEDIFTSRSTKSAHKEIIKDLKEERERTKDLTYEEKLNLYPEKKFRIEFINDWQDNHAKVVFNYINIVRINTLEHYMIDFILFNIGVRFQWRK